ncbi:MAG TPA: SGNH/GDSL hydrolase family protein [Vicinamibacteria bacterium]
MVLDILRPVVFERALLREVAREWGVEDDLARLHGADLALLGAGLAALAAIAFLAWRGRTAALERLALLGLSVGLTLALFEGALRLLMRPLVYRPHLQLVLHPDPEVLPGTTSPSRFSTNGVGMRGPEWDAGARRILCVGGSTTICLYLDDAKAWPARLMALLNEGAPSPRYWVGNVGKSGHDTYHHLALLRRLPEASRVDAVIVLCGVNDLAHAVRASHEARRRMAASSVFDAGGPFNPTHAYFKQAFAYQALKRFVRSADAIYEEDERGHAYARRRQRRRQATPDYPLPALPEHLAAYTANLEAMAALCRERGARVVFLTQPTLWQDPMPPELEALTWFRPIPGTTRTVSSPELARGMAAFNEAMLAFCRQRSLECLDLAAQVPKAARYFFDDEHLTEAGADRVAQAVADYLRARPVAAAAAR